MSKFNLGDIVIYRYNNYCSSPWQLVGKIVAISRNYFGWVYCVESIDCCCDISELTFKVNDDLIKAWGSNPDCEYVSDIAEKTIYGWVIENSLELTDNEEDRGGLQYL